jgi:hypothetical protein
MIALQSKIKLFLISRNWYKEANRRASYWSTGSLGDANVSDMSFKFWNYWVSINTSLGRMRYALMNLRNYWQTSNFNELTIYRDMLRY